MRLTQRDFDAALGFLREIYAPRTVDELADQLVRVLPSLVPADRASYTMCGVLRGRPSDNGRPRIDVRSYPTAQSPPPDLGAFERHMLDHPLIAHYQRTRDGQPLRISDFLSHAQWRRRALYNEFFRQLETEYQTSLYLPAPPPQALGIALSRRYRDFSDRDCAVLSILRPHLVQAHANAVAVSRLRAAAASTVSALEEVEQGVVVLRRDGRVQFMTRRARRWLGVYFRPWPQPGNHLPEELRRWVKEQGAHLNGNGAVGKPREPLMVARAGARLVLRLASNGGQTLLMMTEEVTEVSPASLAPLGLSRRETEVVRWVAEGKTNVEIGIILGVSPRTVGKHLEQIFQKLDVETRTAAAIRARQAATGVAPTL